jgi:hypothetical protein
VIHIPHCLSSQVNSYGYWLSDHRYHVLRWRLFQLAPGSSRVLPANGRKLRKAEGYWEMRGKCRKNFAWNT